jgi:hypothetical protein
MRLQNVNAIANRSQQLAASGLGSGLGVEHLRWAQVGGG